MSKPIWGRDRYGHYVIFGTFRAAMPDAATAQLTAAAPDLLAACKMLASAHARLADDVRPQVALGSAEMRQLLAAITKAESE